MALAPMPFRTALLTDLKSWLLRNEWVRWLQSLKDAIDATAQGLGGVSLVLQSASLPATTIITAPATGLYRVTYYARITRPATTSSSLTVTVRWTDGGVAQAASNTAMTGNTTTTQQSAQGLLGVDQGTDITIETAYVSVGATPMQYALSARVELVP